MKSLLLLAGLAFVPSLAFGLTAAVESRGGMPTLVVDGRPAPSLWFWHRQIGAPAPRPVRVGLEWQSFETTFTAPTADSEVALHVVNGGETGAWWIDDVELFEGTPDGPHGRNQVLCGGFEQGRDAVEKSWRLFVSPAARAKASWSLDTVRPASGKASFRADVVHAGAESWHVHLYQRDHRIEPGKRYTFRLKLRADRPRRLQLQVVRQRPPWTVYGGGQSSAAAEIRLACDAGFHIHSFPLPLVWPRDGQAPDYTQVDAEIRDHLALDPQALLVPRIHTDAPAWWKDRHPAHVMLYDYGRRHMVSVASTEWRRDAEQALRLLVRHLEQRFGSHVLGYHVSGQSAGEWFYDSTWEKIMPNFEEPFRDGFRRWLRAKYRTDQALQSAWGATARLEQVEVPTLAQRTAAADGNFRDPRSQRPVIDFFHYSQEAIVEPMEVFCRAVKEECGRRKLVVVFYAYHFELASFYYGPQITGHFLAERLLRSPDIDMLASPISYFDRHPGGTAPLMSPIDSVQLHGKLWMIEDDTRTYLSPPESGFGRADTPQATLWAHQRNFGRLLAHGCGMWWMDLGDGWLAGRDLWEGAARLRQRWTQTAPPVRPAPDVAVILDEKSVFYLPCANTLTQPLAEFRKQLSSIGCSVGYYLMRDLEAGLVPDAKLYLMLNAFAVQPDQREALHRQLRRDGKWTVWFYAPGYLDGHSGHGDMSRLVGIGLDRVPSAGPARIVAQARGILAPVAERAELRIGRSTSLATRFRAAADQSGVEILGRYPDTSDAALALRRTPAWTSAFCGSPALSAGVLRELARAAGCHVWLETPDVLVAGPRTVMIHAAAPGNKTLAIPGDVVLADPETGKPHRGKLEIPLQLGETRLFVIEKAR